MQSTHETWKPIPGYEGWYEASSFGRVRSLDRFSPSNGGIRAIRGRVLKNQKHHTGYVQVSLCKNGMKESRRVHHLVLEAFIGPRPEGMEACHNDDDPDNNQLSNLRWDSKSANQLDKVRRGTHNNGRKTHCPRGHAYVEENIYRPPYNPRERVCRSCKRDHHRATTAARRTSGESR